MQSQSALDNYKWKSLAGAFLLIGIVSLLFSASNYHRLSQRQSRCTIPVTAEVIDYNQHTHRNVNRNATIRRYETYFYPIFEFELNEESFLVEYQRGWDYKPFSIGDEVVVMCNPSSPTDLYIRGTDSYIPVIFGAVAGLVMLGASAYSMYRKTKCSRNAR